jgi:HEAT repeat protein
MLSSEEDSDAARSALREIDAVDPDAVPVLIKALENGEGRVRYYAVFYLGKLGPAAKDALPALQRLSEEDGGFRFRSFLTKTIRSIEGESDE